MIVTETEKLYSPLEFFLRDKEDAQAGVYDDIDYWRDELSHGEALEFKDSIDLAIYRDLERMGTDRGMMAYCRSDVLSGKVYSLVPSVEAHGGKLWCAAELRLNEPLTPEEMAELKDWWSGQLSDGWGEGFEQREIKVGRGDLYVVPWSASDSFFIDTREEFAHRLGIEELRRLSIQFPAEAEAEQAAPGAIAGEKQAEPAPASRVPDKEELEALKLSVRLEQNLSDYHKSLMSLDKADLIGKAREIAAMNDAHEYLTEEYEFTAGEVAFLLKFQNPLQIVADNWPTQNGLIDVSHVMRGILRQPVTLQKHYALVSDAPSAPKVQDGRGDMDAGEFQDKMAALLGGFDKESMQSLLSYAEELDQDGICELDVFFTLTFVEFYLVTRDYGPELSQRLLDVYKTFALNPFELRGASHHLNGGADAERIGQLAVDGKCDRSTMEWEQSDEVLTDFKDGLLANPGRPQSLSASVGKLEQGLSPREPTVEKPSVLDRIREAAKAPKEPRKDKPARDKSGPEL